MPDYIRILQQGGTFFFTVVTHNRAPLFNSPVTRVMLREAMNDVEEKFPFEIDAICLLPDHLNCMWTLPEGDSNHSTRWRRIKCIFSQSYGSHFSQPLVRNASREKRGEQAIWQRRFW